MQVVVNTRLDQLTAQIEALESQVEAEISVQRANLRYGLEKGRIVFDEEIVRRHKELRIGLLAYLGQAGPLVILTAPVIYSGIVPLLLLDLFLIIYQAACFPVYGLDKVSRRDHMIFDRHHLGYLNALQKLNCAYCSYANGLISYAREIAGRTEQYWCPIKHARHVVGAHAKYRDFSEYGDAEAFEARLAELRGTGGGNS